MAVQTFYTKFTLFTSGVAAALDSVDGNSLLDGDIAIVTNGGYFYFFLLDADSGAAEASPEVISPDTNAGTKRWIRQTTANVSGVGGFDDEGSAAPTTGTWALGWRRRNTVPTAGGNIGWVNLTEGGLNFKAFGPING